jgi:hypothetical protein
MPHHASASSALDGRARGWFRRAVSRLVVGIAVTSLVLSAPATLVAAPNPVSAGATLRGAIQPGKRAVGRVHVASAHGSAAVAAAHPRATKARSASRPRKVPIAHPAAGPAAVTSSTPTPRIAIPDVAVAKQFTGLAMVESGNFEPPDPWVAASTSYVVQAVNASVRVSTRSGGEVLTIPTWALFGLPADQSPSDARIIWDAAHGRWVGNVLSFNNDLSVNYLTLAVSDSSDPTAGWTLFPVQFTGYLPDYPSLASASDKIVVADNLFASAGPFVAADINTFTWASILAGSALTFNSCDSSSYANPRGAQVLSSSNDVHMILEATADSHQWYYRITATGMCSQIINGTDLTSGLGLLAFAPAPAPNQTGPDTIANAFDERPTDAIWQSGHLWWVSTYPVTYDGGATHNDGVALWSTTTPASGVPTTANQLFIAPGGLGNPTDAFMGGIGMSQAGTLFVVYSQSSPTAPVAFMANRLVGGAFGSPRSLDISNAPYGGERWGDYAGVAMDPLGTGAVWATDEVAAQDGSWRTDVARLIIDTEVPTTPGAPSATIVAPTPLYLTPKFRLTWTGATDVSSGAVTYRLEQKVDAGAFGAAISLSGVSVVRSLAVGHAYQFRVAAVDVVGHLGGWATGPVLSPSLVQQTSSTVYVGTWLTHIATEFSGGSARYASALGATATFTTTLVRSIGFVTTKATTRGAFRVYIDGVLKATINAYSTTLAYRTVIYQYTWPTPGTHSMKIYVLGSAGHPRVDVDAFVVLK